MDSDRWQHIQSLFHEAADLAPDEQRAYLERACSGDGTLLASVLAMLEEDARAASLLDRDVAHLAHQMLETAGEASLPTSEFGPYRLTKTLGEGGMGTVYLAERQDLGSVAAVKILRDAWLSPARRERFAAEQRALAQLNHPSIAHLYDADVRPDGTPWFAMEYVDGVPLTEYCRTHGSSVAERLRLFRDICEAVQHAHRHLVIHRDLKPSNILVTRDGHVKLLDFGISKQLETLERPVDQTRTALRMMTPAYAAPEQIRGDRVGIHTDVYALGVVLYELLAGRIPFDLSNRTPAEAEAMIVQDAPERPSAVARRMARDSRSEVRMPSASRTAWADLDVLCLTAIHKDPQRRYPTVEALVRDVDHFVEGEPLEARRDSVRYRAGKFVRRNWRPLSGAAAVLMVIISMAAFYTIRLTDARNAALSEAARTQRIQRFMLNLFEGGDAAAGPAENLRVMTLIDRGVQQAQGLDAEPVVQAELYATLGSIYQKLGQLEQANGLLQSALERRQALLGPDDPEVADSLVALGRLRDAQAKYDEAERLIRDGLEKNRNLLGPTHPAVARATTALGQVLENRGAYDQAIAVLEEAVRLHSLPGADEADLAAALSELANSHFYAGHYDESESVNQRILAIRRRLYSDRHPSVADTLINLGAVQFERGRYSDAERFDREALEIIRAWYGSNHPATASALTMLGRAIIQQSVRYDEAAEVLRESLAIQERVHGPVHPRVASALNELGLVALRQGNLDEAEARFQRMTDVYRQVYQDKHYYIGVALSNLGGVYQQRAQYPRAEALFREVLRRYAETLPAEHQLVGIAQVRLGRQLVRQRRYADAEREILKGYEILMKQTSPPARWIDFAREDLVTVYGALNHPEKAESFRPAIASSGR
jgi:serine/threonine protein kinase/tetratricopeptide (TPR) repeat protein